MGMSYQYYTILLETYSVLIVGTLLLSQWQFVIRFIPYKNYLQVMKVLCSRHRQLILLCASGVGTQVSRVLHRYTITTRSLATRRS